MAAPATRAFSSSFRFLKQGEQTYMVPPALGKFSIRSFRGVGAVGLAQGGYADDIREEGFAPLKELMENFAEAGGSMYVCSPCFKKRKLDENALVAGAAITGGTKLVEFLSDRSPCVSY